MLHEPVGGPQKEDYAESYKTRLGIIMFVIYAIIYAGFVAINTIKPKLMEIDIWGLNLAVVYGFGLIIIAFILAMIYNTMCSKKETELNK